MNVSGQRVAVIGRAAYLGESERGSEIDAHDFVIRVNWSLPIPERLHEHVGSRTDLLYTMQTLHFRALHRAAARIGVPAQKVNATLRDQMAEEAIRDAGGSIPFRYMPNTGTVAIFDAIRNDAAEVSAYGFSLHTDRRYVDTGASHDNRTRWAGHRARGSKRTHNPEFDRRLMRKLAATDPRFKPDAYLVNILENDPEPDMPSIAEDVAVEIARWRKDAEVLKRHKDDRAAVLIEMKAAAIEAILKAHRGD